MNLDVWDYIGLAITVPLVAILWLGAAFAVFLIGKAFYAAWKEKP
jgi:hypothetical protein